MSDNAPFGFDLQIIRVPQEVVTAVFAFSTKGAAINAAKVIGDALRNDGWRDAPS